MERRLAAILAVDVVGYTRLMSEDQTGTLAALRHLRTELFGPAVAANRGNLIKSMGDGWIVEFSSISDAVACAIEVQEALANHASIRLRCGIHIGDVVFEEEDVFGEGVNVAARLEALADPGQIAISDTAYNSLDGAAGRQFFGGDSHELKNVARPVAVWLWPRKSQTAVESKPAKEEAGLPLPEKPSIAVLPFDNMSGDPEQEYFTDGMTEDIITDLAGVPGLFVIARNTTFTFKDKSHNISEIARQLGVHFVLEGSVRKSGARVRITAQLIDGVTGGHVWAERYDRDVTDIFALQDDVREKIVHALEINLVGAGAPGMRAETNVPEAYDCLLRGREQYRLFTSSGNRNAKALYEKAIQLDPDYAAPYAGLSEVCLHDWFLGSAPDLDKAYELAVKAAQLNPDLPLVCEALSSAYLFRKQHEDAIAILQKWIDLEPNSADAYATLAGTLHFAGEPEKVDALIEIATRLNPYYPFYYTLYRGHARFAMERYGEALDFIKRAAFHNPASPHPHVYLAACLALMGEKEAAKKALADLFRIHPDFSITWVQIYLPYKRAGDMERLVEGLRRAGLPE